ncbi:MAG TPA: ABC transporter substrate-binding protein [Tissierellales bacterium]|nr:ABC transporter substrate-binding protein [Tissierellales bacterium]
MLKKRRISLIFSIFLIFTLVLTGCGPKEKDVDGPKEGNESGEPKYGGIYSTYIGSDFETLDPAFATAALDGSLVSLIYDSLIRFDTEGKIIPGLAESWETPDDVTYVFTLVENAKFHNGNSCTAEDVKYSFERVMNPEVNSPRTWVFEKVKGAEDFNEGKADEIEGIEVLEDYKLQITLEQPFAPFLSMLGMPAAHIVDEEEIKKYSDQKDYALEPVGTGPYIFESYSAGDKLVLNGNEDYFDGRPYLDGIQYRVIEENATAVAEFEAGNIDYLGIPSEDLERFKNNPDYEPYIVNVNTFWNYYIGLTSNTEPFDDVKVRQAFNYAIDKETLINTVRKDNAIVSHGPIPPGLEGYRDDFKAYEYDPDKAKELLKEAGYSKENPCKFEFLYAEATENVEILEPIQAMLKEAGFEPKLTSMEWNAYREEVRLGNADAFWLSWGADYPDAENYLYPLFHSSMSGGGGNETRYDNPEVDKLLEKSHNILDSEERIKIYHEIEDIIVEDAARAWIYVSVNWNLYKPEVKGIKDYRIFNADKMLDIWLDR